MTPAWQFCAPGEVLDVLWAELAADLQGYSQSRDGVLSQDLKPREEAKK